MKIIRILVFILLLCSYSIILTSCWNYRELEELSIVSGVAIDLASNGNYKLAVEVVEVGGGKEAQTKAKIITVEGKTVFDAARNGISIAGKKLYWSHAKVLIISQEIAGKGVLGIIDWFNRDSETREDINILISKGPANEILEGQALTEPVKSFELENIITNESNLSKARKVELWELTNEISAEGLAATIPLVYMDQVEDKTIPRVAGTAIFTGDKLLGFIDGEKTKDMLFLKDQIKGGLLIEGKDRAVGEVPVSLEIFNSKTKIKPSISGSNLEMNVDVETIVAIDEIEGVLNVIEADGRKKLEQSAEKELKQRLEALVKIAQAEFGQDIFGFGLILSRENPKLWKQISKDWENKFKDLKINVKTRVHIRNSGMLAEPLEVGE